MILSGGVGFSVSSIRFPLPGQASIMSRSRRQHPPVGLSPHGDEPRFLVEREGAGVVERVGVDRHPPGPRPVPGHVQCGVQQKGTETAADRLRHQPEIGEVAAPRRRGSRARRSRAASRRG